MPSSSLSARTGIGSDQAPTCDPRRTQSAYLTVLALFALVGGGHLFGAAVAFGELCGLRAPTWAGPAETFLTPAGLLGAGIWLAWLLTTRPNPADAARRRWRPIAVAGAALLVIALDASGRLTGDGGSTRVVGHLVELVVWTLLAVEAAARCGVTVRPLGLAGRTRPGESSTAATTTKAGRAAQAWLVGFAFVACALLSKAVWSVLESLPGPVLHGDQAAAAGVPDLGSLLAHGLVWSPMVEELLVTVVVVGVLAAARRPLWECITVSVLMRTLPHAYVGLPMLAIVPVGVASAWLYHRYRRAIPLILGHAAYNASTILLPLPLVPALFIATLLTLAAWIWTETASGQRPLKGDAR